MGKFCGVRFGVLCFVLALTSIASVGAKAETGPQQMQGTGKRGGCAQPRFEVATIRPVDPHKVNPMEVRVYPGGRLVIHAVSFKGLVFDAFDMRGWQVSGGDDWMNKAEFDIEAKPPELCRAEVSVGEYQWFGVQSRYVREALKALLIDRFGLKYHMETKTGAVYALERNGKLLRLKPVDVKLYQNTDGKEVENSDSQPTGQIGFVTGVPASLYRISMQQLANDLSGSTVRAPVQDQTGLKGYFNFQSHNMAMDDDMGANSNSLLLDMLPEMGLKLVKTQGPVEELVIDAAQMPSAN